MKNFLQLLNRLSHAINSVSLAILFAVSILASTLISISGCAHEPASEMKASTTTVTLPASKPPVGKADVAKDATASAQVKPATGAISASVESEAIAAKMAAAREAAAAQLAATRTQMNKDFYLILSQWAKIDLKLKKNPASVTVLDLTCSIKYVEPKKGSSDDGSTSTCTYDLATGKGKSARKGTQSGSSAEKMRELMIGLPIMQGESGGFTQYLKCDSVANESVCSIAIPVLYEGP